MKYTFLLPAYKLKYLEESLKSILNQTYRDFKVIVSDDCSPEDIKSVVERYASDNRLIYRRNEKNMGASSLVSHWNLLVNMCDTEYLIMASDDDIYDANFLENIDNLIKKYPNVSIIHARCRIIDGDGKTKQEDCTYDEYVSWTGFLSQHFYLKHVECMANHVFKTSALKGIGGVVDFPLAWCSDTATTAALASQGVVNTNQILFSFRMSGINISSATIEKKDVSKKKYLALCQFDDYMEKLYKNITVKSSSQLYLLRKVKQDYGDLVFYTSIQYLKIMNLSDFQDYIRTFKSKGYIKGKHNVLKFVYKWFCARFLSHVS